MAGKQVIPILQVDAFTGQPFGGNPAAVCLVPPPQQQGQPPLLSDAQRQAIAAEMNLSETAFVEMLPAAAAAAGGQFAGGDTSSFGLRWFTPTTEVPLCGHATLAAAAAIFAAGNTCRRVSFHTKSGELVVSRIGADGGSAVDGGDGGGASRGASGAAPAPAEAPWLAMDLPLLPPTDAVPAQLGPGSELVKRVACGLPVREVRWRASIGYLLVALEDDDDEDDGGNGSGGNDAGGARDGGGATALGSGSASGSGGVEGPRRAAQLEAMRPDIQGLLGSASREGTGLAGVIVTARGGRRGGPHDFCSRFFGPWMGIDEDPVTGSAHCLLGPYWAERLGKRTLLARQCSARGGELRVTLPPDNGGDGAGIGGDGDGSSGGGGGGGGSDGVGGSGIIRVEGQAVVVLRGELLL